LRRVECSLRLRWANLMHLLRNYQIDLGFDRADRVITLIRSLRQKNFSSKLTNLADKYISELGFSYEFFTTGSEYPILQ